jgi:hypothetical protein
VGAGEADAEGGRVSVTPERLAKLIADELRPGLRVIVREELQHVDREPDEWITPKQAAARWGYTARWWRSHADEFGARRDPRIWLNTATVEHVLSQRRAA